MKIFYLSLAIYVACSTLVKAQALEVEHEHELQIRNGYQKSEWTEHSAELFSSVYFPFSDSLSLIANTVVRADAKNKLDSKRFSANVRQLYLQGEHGSITWQFGTQYHNWQSMDGLTALSMVSPRDFTRFILDDYAQSALGQFGLSVSDAKENNEWQLLILRAKPHEFPEQDELFAFKASRLRFGFPINEDKSNTAIKQNTLDNNQPLFAARYKQYQNGWEWGVQMRAGPDFEPIARIVVNHQQPSLQRYYEHRTTLSAHANTQFGSTVLRGQINFSPKRYFNTNMQGELAVSRHHQWQVAAGVDWQAPGDIFVNAQVIVDSVVNASDHLVRPSTDVITTVSMNHYFNNEQWRVDAKWFGSNKRDGLIRLGLTHYYNDFINFKMGLDAFYGETQDLFGQYTKGDNMYLEIQAFF